ncbi:MAG TPA: isoprenyl transferase [Bacteroidetes bacterium]|nr:isoprenyl transferase [Bacteroidota bacterium]
MTQDETVQQELKKTGNLPRHIAIIMDGNGRWARMRGLPRVSGHKQAIKSVRDVVEACGELDIDVLTLYTFSMENWQRPKAEVNALMKLMVNTIKHEIDDLLKNNVRLITMGHLHDLPKPTRESMQYGIDVTQNCTGLTLNLALSYGGRLEIVDAVKSVAAKVKNGEMELENIDEQLFSGFLYTKNLPDPDLLIRTSGELRISNFLLWQLAYTEMYITDLLWPDFRRQHLYDAIRAYQKRERRFGRVSNQL